MRLVEENQPQGGYVNQPAHVSGLVEEHQPVDDSFTAPDPVRSLFTAPTMGTDQSKVGGGLGNRVEDDIGGKEDDMVMKEDDRDTARPALRSGNQSNNTKIGSRDTPVPDVPGVTPGPCQDDRVGDGGAEFSNLSSDTEASMLAASMAADALLGTERSNGGSQPNGFSDDMRLGRQDDKMVDPEREGESRTGWCSLHGV